MGGNVSVDPYSTHIGALAWALPLTTGPVVELGGGWYSTPLLHGYCESVGREMWTVEDDDYFMGAVQEYWPAPWHHYVLDPAYGIPVKEPGLVFIDAGTIYRAPLVLAAREAEAELVVVHDTEDPPVGGRPDWGEPYPGMADACAVFKYRRDFNVFSERTTVLSDILALDMTKKV